MQTDLFGPDGAAKPDSWVGKVRQEDKQIVSELVAVRAYQVDESEANAQRRLNVRAAATTQVADPAEQYVDGDCAHTDQDEERELDAIDQRLPVSGGDNDEIAGTTHEEVEAVGRALEKDDAEAARRERLEAMAAPQRR